ncbi:TIR-only protein, partial [Andrographis paniculata]|uniref:TIR-only protein n=1 Tax=Andrographis paniculata TaxID=175694 RepID=UPI0021E86183
MQRSPITAVAAVGRQFLRSKPRRRGACEVFVNHRGIDTKRHVAGLLHHHLGGAGVRAFLDSKSMKPGDKLFDKIHVAIGECKVGVAVFSPMYCESYFCLHELSLMVQARKRLVPIFCDVKPSELRVKDHYGGAACTAEDLRRFRSALEQAKYTVGLTFDTLQGDWAEFLASATDVVMKNLAEVEEEE